MQEIQYNSMNRDDLQWQSAFNRRAIAHVVVFCLQYGQSLYLLKAVLISLNRAKQKTSADEEIWGESLDYIQIEVVGGQSGVRTIVRVSLTHGSFAIGSSCWTLSRLLSVFSYCSKNSVFC